MSYTTGTTNYDLPQYVGTDTPSWTDFNEGFAEVDSALGGAVSTVSTVGDRVTALETTVSGDDGLVTTVSSIQSDLTELEGTVSGHTTSISNLGTEIDDVRSDCEDMITSNEETSATSANAYAVGDYFRYNDVLYKCTVAIAEGDTIVPNTNCEATNVMTEITSGGVSVSAEDVTYDNTDSGLTATDVQSAIDEINDSMISQFQVTPNTVSTEAGDTEVSFTATEDQVITIMCYVQSDSSTSACTAIIGLNRDGTTYNLTRGLSTSRVGASAVFTAEAGDVITLNLNAPSDGTSTLKRVTSNVTFS